MPTCGLPAFFSCSCCGLAAFSVLVLVLLVNLSMSFSCAEFRSEVSQYAVSPRDKETVFSF